MNSRTALYLIPFILSFLRPAAANDLSQALKTQQIELESLESDLGMYRENMKNLAIREKELRGNIGLIETKIGKYKYEVADILEKMEEVDSNILYLRQQLKKEKAVSSRYIDMLRVFLGYYHKEKKKIDTLPWFAPLISPVPAEIFTKKLSVIIPAEKFVQVNLEIRNIKSLTEELEQERANQNILKEKLIDVQKNLIIEKKRKLLILRNTKQERSRIKTLVSSLEKRAGNLKRLQVLARDFIPAKGNLPWPVQGTVKAYFGKQQHPQLDTYIISRGISVAASEGPGSLVNTIAAGEVVYADDFEGLGKMVVIEHGNGYYTLYANLKELLVRDGAEIGPVIPLGTAGIKDVYFEIGKGSTPQDPLIWLEKKTDNK